MEHYKIKGSDIHEILSQHSLVANNIKKYPKSGQRQVFEIAFSTGESSILKFVDISPHDTYGYIDDLSEEEFYRAVERAEFKQAVKAEVKQKSARIVRELKAAKNCPILPQLEILENYEIFKKEAYEFIYYFETKFNGKTLDESMLYKEELDIDTIISFLYQMIKQIQIMYENGFVHRDLTPRNIIYCEGEFKIIDAGLIKPHSDDDESLTVTNMRIGTPRYWAPEQNKRSSDFSWDFRTDLFPVGLIAIELFLQDTRYLPKELRTELHFIFAKWLEKDDSDKSRKLFRNVIARLVTVRHKRWKKLDELLLVLEQLKEEEN